MSEKIHRSLHSDTMLDRIEHITEVSEYIENQLERSSSKPDPHPIWFEIFPIAQEERPAVFVLPTIS